ncbi:MAG: Gfo/Idh/MocA family oxidoreductase, partial [Alphaproteobacteria bacterium]|nr:Gfo/Idh/MocA family oxidoreductase [Alphaproteobacteria bacterium]
SSPDKAAAFQAFAPGLRIHDSYQALLDAPEIDAVYIPLPNAMHVDWTLKALAAGKHVLCEKPMTMAEAEFDSLIAARDASGKLAAEAYMIVHHPQWQRARELVQSGAIGTLRHVDGAFSFFNTDMSNIRNQAETGGGALGDIGVYPFGATRFVTGAEPVSVKARIDFENGVDTFSLVTAQFPDFTFSGMVSIRLALRQEIVFHGDKGVLRLTAPFNAGVFGEAMVHLRQGPQERTERFTEARQYTLQVEAFCRSVRTGAPYPCPLEFSRGTQRMIDMVFEAGKAG